MAIATPATTLSDGPLTSLHFTEICWYFSILCASRAPYATDSTAPHTPSGYACTGFLFHPRQHRCQKPTRRMHYPTFYFVAFCSLRSPSNNYHNVGSRLCLPPGPAHNPTSTTSRPPIEPHVHAPAHLHAMHRHPRSIPSAPAFLPTQRRNPYRRLPQALGAAAVAAASSGSCLPGTFPAAAAATACR